MEDLSLLGTRLQVRMNVTKTTITSESRNRMVVTNLTRARNQRHHRLINGGCGAYAYQLDEDDECRSNFYCLHLGFIKTNQTVSWDTKVRRRCPVKRIDVNVSDQRVYLERTNHKQLNNDINGMILQYLLQQGLRITWQRLQWRIYCFHWMHKPSR